MLHPHFPLIIIIIIIIMTISLSWVSAFGETQQKSNRFFRFDEQSNSWVLVDLPYDLVTCVNGDCKVVGSIREAPEKSQGETVTITNDDDHNDVKVVVQEEQKKKDSFCSRKKKLLPLRKRVSLTRMSDTSIWVTGESGSIYERFWNGVQWVIAPHDLPSSAGAAVSVLTVNQTILALSEAGFLYQMQLTEKSELVWMEVAAAIEQHGVGGKGADRYLIKSAVVGNDNERAFFCTKNGTLLELTQIETPPRFVNHGQPPGADVAAIADVGSIRGNLVFTISSAGDLYEHDSNSKPPWKKHVWSEQSIEDTALIPLRGCTTQGIGGASSMSLFLITKGGKLVERRLNQRKWKWIVHGSLENELLTSITPVVQQQQNPSEKYSVFLSTASGSILEYQIMKQAGVSNEHQLQDSWVNHEHPPHAKVARGIPGIAYQFGRTLYALDDGRLAELHLPGLGGENSGPTYQLNNNNRRKTPPKYTWSVLDAPESEGWNAEYCTEERGPSNCMMGVKDETNEFGSTRTMTRRRKGTQPTYLIPDASSSSLDETWQVEEKWMNRNFHMRLMQGGRSFFMVSSGGLTFEYLYNDNVGLWLRHEHPTAMEGAVGSYNGSLFFVDIQGDVVIRERVGNELEWINCTAMKKGRQVISGPPWDRIYRTGIKVTAQDALYFVSKSGRLLQFTVALRNFKWKDCKNPANTKVATVVDQQVLRDKVVFVIGQNGRLYQYNALYGTWHEHYQSQHMILSRLPGTSMRSSSTMSLKGSLFMISEDGALVEYHWNSQDGWMWVEHGTPNNGGGVSFKGAPGPSFEDHQLLFLIGSDGKVYLRYLDRMEWKWKDCGFPDAENAKETKTGTRRNDEEDTKCDPKVASTRPIRSAEDTVIFELRDGRLAELRQVQHSDWIWLRIIATPTSSCMANFWAAAAAS